MTTNVNPSAGVGAPTEPALNADESPGQAIPAETGAAAPASRASQPSSGAARLWQRWVAGSTPANWIWFWLTMSVVGFSLASYRFFYFDIHKLVRRIPQAAMTWPLLPLHVVFGTIWAIAALVQFVPWIRTRAIWVHRLVGRIYLGTAIVSVGAATALAVILGPVGLFGSRSGLLQGILSTLCFTMAYWTIRYRGDSQRHRGWALRGFAAMFSIIFSRQISYLFLVVPSLPPGWLPVFIRWRLPFLLIVAELINHGWLNQKPLRRTGLPLQVGALCLNLALGVAGAYAGFMILLNEGNLPGLVAIRGRAAAPVTGVENGLVSDFETGQPTVGFGRGWNPSTDKLLGGESTVTLQVVPGGARESQYSLKVSGVLVENTKGPKWAGVLFFPGGGVTSPMNLSAKKEISFWARGDGSIGLVSLRSAARGLKFASHPFKTTETWQEHRFTIASFDGMDGSDLTAVRFATSKAPGAFSFQIDDIEFK